MYSSKVTVIIPVYNNKEDILTAIKSVINQTYKDWELVVVDDCSCISSSSTSGQG